MLELKDLVVDEEMHKRLRRLSDDEIAGLREDMKTRGCLSPIVVWQHHSLVLDGRHRLEICLAEDIDAEIKEMPFDSKEDAQAWMYRHQLDQRNLDPKSISELRGWLAKHEENGDEGIVRQSDEQLSESNGSAPKRGRQPSKRRAANKRAAATTKVSESTIERDRAYADAIERIEKLNAKAAADIRDGTIKIGKADVVKLAKSENIPAGLRNLRQGLPWNANGKEPKKPKGAPKGLERSPAKLVDELSKKHVGPLIRGIDAVAEINGGKGEFHGKANAALETFLQALKEMRGGKR